MIFTATRARREAPFCGCGGLVSLGYVWGGRARAGAGACCSRGAATKKRENLTFHVLDAPPGPLVRAAGWGQAGAEGMGFPAEKKQSKAHGMDRALRP